MSAAYRELLEAAIAHLEDLEAKGVVHVDVRPGTMAALTNKLAPARSVQSTSAPPKPTAAVSSAFVSPQSRRVEPESFAAVFEPAAAPHASQPPTLNPVFKLPVVNPLPPKLPSAEKAAAFAALQKKVLACHQCAHLVASRHTVVFGVGDPNARILFVGEAPGADEDRAGEPFVGRAGELLTRIITAMGLSRETVFIANILKCRPDMPPGISGNRKPRPDEMATCAPWLQAQIDLIQPEAMVALGSTAVEGLLGGPVGITKLRGKWQSYRGIPLMPTYHPAYLLRNQVITEKRKVWEDMMAVMEKVGMPISAKQRAYFTSP